MSPGLIQRLPFKCTCRIEYVRLSDGSERNVLVDRCPKHQAFHNLEQRMFEALRACVEILGEHDHADAVRAYGIDTVKLGLAGCRECEALDEIGAIFRQVEAA